MALPVAGAAGGGEGWLRLGTPLHLEGMWALSGGGAIGGLVLALLVPVIALSAAEAPALLVPVRMRCWWRRLPRNHGYRPHIPVRLRRAVYAADRYRCVWCKAGVSLQLDHVRPWAAGGLTVIWNAVTLCGTCNKTKSDYWERKGHIRYHPFPGFSDEALARAILRCERRHRLNIFRWLRAGWSLG